MRTKISCRAIIGCTHIKTDIDWSRLKTAVNDAKAGRNVLLSAQLV